jgi:hypothetical protein
MPDFEDIPDITAPRPGPRRAPDVGPWQRVHGAPLTRREVEHRKRLALVVSVVWIAVQFFAFGVRGDLSRLPWAYLFMLCVAPMSAGFIAVALAVRGGSFGLGTRTALVSALAVLGPLSFMVSGFLMPVPYANGEIGDLSFGAYCLNCTVAWALLPIVAAGLALRGAFAASSVWRSALLGAGCGLIAAGLFTLHCPVVGKWHIAIAHGSAVLISAIIGGVCLAWATRS